MNPQFTASAKDLECMAYALKLAARGMYTTDPNPNVGCLIVDAAGAHLGEGWHERAGQGHAEVHALAAAGVGARGATAYVTLEPCAHQGRTAACTAALISAGVGRVVYAMQDPNPLVAGKGDAALRSAGIEVLDGVLEDAAAELNRGYVHRMQHGRPWVRSKLAISLDGRTALASGESQWITGAAARTDVHRWRARSSVVMTGSGTVLADDPSLNARTTDAQDVLQPVRLIVDSNLATPPNARVFDTDSPVLIYHCEVPDGATAGLEKAGAQLHAMPSTAKRVDLDELLRDLGTQQINDVLVEAGPVLNGGLLDRGLIDELIVYQASSILGADSRGMFAINPLASMADRQYLELTDIRKVGTDVRMIYRLKNTRGN